MTEAVSEGGPEALKQGGGHTSAGLQGVRETERHLVVPGSGLP